MPRFALVGWFPADHAERVADETEAETIEHLNEAINARDGSALLSIAGEMHYADLAHHYENLDDEDRDFFLKTIGPELATDVIGELPWTLIEEALQHFKPAQLRIILGNLSDDDRVDIFQIVSPESQRRYFSLLGPHDEQLTRNLLKYEEDTAGGRMTTAIGRITADMTVKQAITVLRRDQDSAETLARIFVVDEEGRLVGKVRLRDLAFHPWPTMIHDIMENADERVLATVDQEEAARMLSKYDLIVLPVVDEFDHLLGVITYDDAMEILQEESTEDIEKLAAIGGEQSELSYLNTSVQSHFRRRVIWLVALAFVSIFSGYVMFRFSAVLNQAYVLSLFLPMVVAAGGNSGGQAATMVIRAMSLGEVNTGTALRIAWKEMQTGILLGLSLGLVMGAFILFLLPLFQVPQAIPYPKLAMAVCASLLIQVFSATLMGSMLPLLARSIWLDPAVVSAPSLASTVDITGMLIYFSSARLILSL
ncbi:MAG: magnesium transporter [Verrucomicrobia bacterium]|nr:magnesium transporter [Verrucomicrobiota bacterium]